MAIRHSFNPAALSRTPQTQAEAAPELQVDYSHTQWRQAQMLQLERGYLAACAGVEAATA